MVGVSEVSSLPNPADIHWYTLWKHRRAFCSAETFANDLWWSTVVYSYLFYKQPCPFFRIATGTNTVQFSCSLCTTRLPSTVPSSGSSAEWRAYVTWHFCEQGTQLMSRQRVPENVGVILPYVSITNYEGQQGLLWKCLFVTMTFLFLWSALSAKLLSCFSLFFVGALSCENSFHFQGQLDDWDLDAVAKQQSTKWHQMVLTMLTHLFVSLCDTATPWFQEVEHSDILNQCSLFDSLVLIFGLFAALLWCFEKRTRSSYPVFGDLWVVHSFSPARIPSMPGKSHNISLNSLFKMGFLYHQNAGVLWHAGSDFRSFVFNEGRYRQMRSEGSETSHIST